MKARVAGLLLMLGIAAQFVVPGWMLLQRELTLRHGAVCLLRTAPVDPADAFRGRYVALRFRDFDSFTDENSHKWRRGDRVWLQVQTNALGVATIAALAAEPSDDLGFWAHVSYLRNEEVPVVPAATNQWGQVKMRDSGRTRVHLHELPCDRYYLPERLAPQAEESYNKASRESGREAHARVRVWRGMVFLEDLLIDGTPVRQFLEQEESGEK